MKLKVPQRFQLLKSYVLIYLLLSFLTRLALYIWSFENVDFSVLGFLQVFIYGLFFDWGTISFFVLPYALYLLLFPAQYTGNKLDRITQYLGYFAGLLIFTFSTLSEFTFWEEFNSRFNFIAVDYLVYTEEVVANINESYPLPILLSGVLLVVFSIMFITSKRGAFQKTFSESGTIRQKMTLLITALVLSGFYTLSIENKDAEWSENRYENELTKSGIYSFFAAFRNNELSYPDFYLTQDITTSFKVMKEHVLSPNEKWLDKDYRSFKRLVTNPGEEKRPNVIFICVESLSAKYLARFDNDQYSFVYTPYLDSLMQHSISFNNLYATGTRTIRGMEAITLCVPPSPGRSIVKRPENGNFFNIGSVFAQKGYKNVFFYGGDGYFDNMNQFFGGNGFEIVDRGRGYLMGDDFKSKRTNINDDEVSFENAWGICDEDIYNKVIKEADIHHENGQPFFNFVMTTSNHRPYTYPDHKIDVPSGRGRDGAVKYTDYAIHAFLEKARQKPWFKNTVFLIMADHCASSAGKQELDVAKYHIPALIYNLTNDSAHEVNTICSQIDIFPTLFGYLNWTYESKLLGRDLTKIKPEEEMALIANYRKLGLLKGKQLMVLNDKKSSHFYQWDKSTNQLDLLPTDSAFLKLTVGYYQTNDYLYQHQYQKLD
ncbi:MAG: LTA synthase family protein [Flavobacteriales bacterium]|nr:LTA synthase family protein [Flavobacteriales bacterium]